MAIKAFSHVFQMLFLAGGTLLLLLIVLSGSIDNFPINRFYWIEADTSNIPNAPDYSRWTFWGICEKSGSKNKNCKDLLPLYPFSPVDNFGTTQNVPKDFVNNQDVYYYLTRCSWSFFLISLVFVGVSFISSLFACFWHSLRSVLTLFVTIGLIFDMAGIALETLAVVLGRNAFKDAGLDHSIGVKLMAIGWASFVVVILAWFGTCCALLTGVYRKHKEFVENEKLSKGLGSGPILASDGLGHDEELGAATPAAPAPAPAQPVPSAQQNQGTLVSNEGGIRFFKIRRNNKVDEDSE